MKPVDAPPEYIRPADAPRFGISRSTLYNLINSGSVKSTVVRQPGNVKGVRLVSVESLRQFIEAQPSA